MSARQRAIARQRRKQFLVGIFDPPASKASAKDGRTLRRFNRKRQYLGGDYFHDEPSVLGFCDANMKVHTPPATGRSTGKVVGWVAKGISRKMNKMIPLNQLKICPSKLEQA